MTESVTRSTGKQENLLNLDVIGPAAVPRKNGELVFETPWESRSFGIAVALSKSGVFDWEEFTNTFDWEYWKIGEGGFRKDAQVELLRDLGRFTGASLA